MALKMLAVSLLLSAILAVTVSSPSKPNNRLDALIQELLTYEQVADCGRLEHPEQGEVSFRSTTHLSIATYTCFSSYELVGDSLRVCQADGTWSGKEPICRQICDCGDPPEIMNGEIDEEMSDPGNTCFVGNSRNITQKTYICNPGYMFPDGDETFEIRCGINRRWIPSMPPNCEPVDCGPLSSPNQGKVSVPSTTLDSVATYTCNTNYNLVGDSKRICQADAEWSGKEPVCQENMTCRRRGSPCTKCKQCCSRRCNKRAKKCC